MAAARGVPRAQVALAWLLRAAHGDGAHRRAPPSLSTSTTRSPRSTLDLGDEELDALEAPYQPHPVSGTATPTTAAARRRTR